MFKTVSADKYAKMIKSSKTYIIRCVTPGHVLQFYTFITEDIL